MKRSPTLQDRINSRLNQKKARAEEGVEEEVEVKADVILYEAGQEEVEGRVEVLSQKTLVKAKVFRKRRMAHPSQRQRLNQGFQNQRRMMNMIKAGGITLGMMHTGMSIRTDGGPTIQLRTGTTMHGCLARSH